MKTLKNLPILFCSFVLFLALNPKAFAYPNFISYGYQSCLACHYNPFGNGPLTDYGRAVSASALSDRLTWGSQVSDEKIASKSDFFFGAKKLAEKNQWLRPHASYRGLFLSRNLGTEFEKNDYLTMDASVGMVVRLLDNKLIFSGQIGYAPPKGLEKDIKKYRTREHYVGYRYSTNWGLYLGLMDKVFGIRVPDHIAFSRSITNLNQNDQTHGLTLHYSKDKIEAGLQAFIGNLVQDSKLRQEGLTGQVEYSLNETTRLGASALFSSSDVQSVNMQALHARTGMGKGNSILFELGHVSKSTKGSDTQSSLYMFMQNHLVLRRGLWALISAESVLPNMGESDYVFRFGPGVQWFPTQRVELRLDFYNTKNYSTFLATDDWYMAGQLHLWL